MASSGLVSSYADPSTGYPRIAVEFRRALLTKASAAAGDGGVGGGVSGEMIRIRGKVVNEEDEESVKEGHERSVRLDDSCSEDSTGRPKGNWAGNGSGES